MHKSIADSSPQRTRILPLLVAGLFIASCGSGDKNEDELVPEPNTYKISGTVSGLEGSGLTLQVAGSPDLVVTESGKFSFSTPITNGTAYRVTILSQPKVPTQTCSIANGEGMAGSATVEILVTCVRLQGRFNYVTNATSSITGFSTDPETGSLTPIGEWDTEPGSYAIATHPTKGYVYLSHATNSASDGISAYSIEPSTGQLTLVARAASGASPNSIAIHPSGQFAYVASGNDSNIYAYRINLEDGQMTLAGSVSSPIPYSVTVHPSGKFVYAVNIGASTVSAFAVDPESGNLTQIDQSTAATELVPFSFAVHPSGKFAYAANRFSDSLSAYAVDEMTGSLSYRSVVAAGSGPNFVAADDSGKFLYVTNGGDGTVSVYSLSPTDGAPTLTASFASDAPLVQAEGSPPASPSPSSISLDPSGRLAYVVNGGHNTLAVFSVDAATGGLNRLGRESTRTFPLYVTTAR